MSREHVRDGGADDGRHRPEDPGRVEPPVQRLADRRVGPAADPAARLGRSRLLPPLAEQLHGDRQPGRRRRPISPSSASPRRRDPRLPGGGGYAVNGLYNLVPAKFGQVSNNITLASDFGEQYQRYHGVLVNVSARLGDGLTVPVRGQQRQDGAGQLRGARAGAGADDHRLGVSPLVGAGQSVVPHDPGFITKVTALGSLHGAEDRRAHQRHLPQRPGRPASRRLERPERLAAADPGTAARRQRPEPDDQPGRAGAVWGDRVNALDLRFAKILRFGRMRYTVGVDMFNAINADTVLTYNQTSTRRPPPARRRGGRRRRY